MERHFAKEIKAGVLTFKAVDVQADENRHFIEEFGLYGRSLAVAEYRDGEMVRHKLLPEAWIYAHSPERLEQYIVQQVSGFIHGAR